MTVKGIDGTVVLEAEDADEWDNFVSLLAMLDGRTPLNEVEAGCVHGCEFDASAVLDALGRVGLVRDAREIWRLQTDAAENPPKASPPLTATEAYALERWRPEEASVALPLPAVTPTSYLASRRRSLPLDRLLYLDPEKSGAAAAAALGQTLRRDRWGHAPVASAGALHPLCAGLLIRRRSSWISTLLDPDSWRCTADHPVDRHLIERAMLADEDWIGKALDRGSPILVLFGDPKRACGKYGNRGWNYLLLEAGAALHHVTLLLLEADHQVRPIGGFAENAIREAFHLDKQADEPIPLITAFAAPHADEGVHER